MRAPGAGIALRAANDSRQPSQSAESHRDQAGAQQHKSGGGYREKSIGDEVVITHDAPATLDDRPILLKISESVGWQTDAAGPGTIGLKGVCKKNAGAE
jgi:hypothetical protein